ncbi:MAG: hypothetical protein LBG71_07730 [Clostridiales Family XIII bacterium]|jgi:transcriptional regulator with XRE-family HTH domain|nr:hypothetical protein [Clostridiales Family XIII bacterium]
MLYEKIERLCKENGTTITALCKEITGSTGNLSTWKKDRFWANALANICIKFNVSADDLLGIPHKMPEFSPLLLEEYSDSALDIAKRYGALDDDGKALVRVAVINAEGRPAVGVSQKITV